MAIVIQGGKAVAAALERVAIRQAAIAQLHADAAAAACQNQSEASAQPATPPAPGGTAGGSSSND